MKSPLKIKHVTVRLTESQYRKFLRKVDRHSDVSNTLRRLIDAFIENRVSVYPPENHHKEN